MQTEKQPPAFKDLILYVLILAVMTGGIWLYFSRDKPVAAGTSPEYAKEYESLKTTIALLSVESDLKSDSIQSLKTQLGQADIVINRSEAKIAELARRVMARPTTPALDGSSVIWTQELKGKLLDCDSMAYELHYVYLDKARQRQELTDSLNMFYEAIIDNKDSIIKSYSTIDTSCLAELMKVTTERDEAIETKEKHKRRSAFGWIAAGTATAIAILSHLFQ